MRTSVLCLSFNDSESDIVYTFKSISAIQAALLITFQRNISEFNYIYYI